MALPPPLWLPPWVAKGTRGVTSAGQNQKSHYESRPVPSHITEQHKPLLSPSSLHTSLVGCQLHLGKVGQEPSRKTHPLLSFCPATRPSSRVTSSVKERKEDKGALQMLLGAQRREGKSCTNQTSSEHLPQQNKQWDFSTNSHSLKGIVSPTNAFHIWFDGIFLPENCCPFSGSRERMTASLPVANRAVTFKYISPILTGCSGELR